MTAMPRRKAGTHQGVKGGQSEFQHLQKSEKKQRSLKLEAVEAVQVGRTPRGKFRVEPCQDDILTMQIFMNWYTEVRPELPGVDPDHDVGPC